MSHTYMFLPSWWQCANYTISTLLAICLMCSILLCSLYIEKLGRLSICFDMHFSWKQGEEFHIPWFMHWQQRGDFWEKLCTFGENFHALGDLAENWYVFVRCCMWGEKLRRRGCICSGGVCICAGGAPLVCLSFVLCGVLFESFVLSRLCRAVALVLGGRDLVWRVILFSLVLWLWITCFGGLYSWLFSFLFLYHGYYGCCQWLNALIKGEIEDQVCPRTSGGSLLSDEWLTTLSGLMLG